MAANIENPMDPELKAKWVEALRSGKYTQGIGMLKDSQGCNCCLGVLAEIVETPANDLWQGTQYEFTVEDGKTYHEMYLPPRGFCGLSEMTMNELAAMNDGNEDAPDAPVPPKTFAEIADYIEENL